MDRGLVDWLRETAPPRRVYQHPPLALALCQVRFNRELGLDGSVLGAFQEAIEGAYPNSDQQIQQTAALQFGPAAQIGVQAAPQSLLWQFMDETGDWTVTLAQDALSLETRVYADFDDFLGRLTTLLTVLQQTVRPKLGRRLGLRYINEIGDEEGAWHRIIRSELLGVLTLAPVREHCDQAVQVLSLTADGARVNLHHGVLPQGTTVVPKPGTAPNTRPFYLLDLDIYREFRPPESLRMDPEALCAEVDRYHQTASAFFRWATTDEYRATLGERDHVG